jgi:hypothetical protein
MKYRYGHQSVKHRFAWRVRDVPRRMLNVVEAVNTHRPGDRYVSADGLPLRLHQPRVAGAPRAHFEIEPRWLEAEV